MTTQSCDHTDDYGSLVAHGICMDCGARVPAGRFARLSRVDAFTLGVAAGLLIAAVLRWFGP